MCNQSLLILDEFDRPTTDIPIEFGENVWGEKPMVRLPEKRILQNGEGGEKE